MGMNRYKGFVTYKDGKEHLAYVWADNLDQAKFRAKELFNGLPIRDLKEFHEISLDADPYWTLNEWMKYIKKLSEEYNPETTILLTDGGHNNVTLSLEVLV